MKKMKNPTTKTLEQTNHHNNEFTDMHDDHYLEQFIEETLDAIDYEVLDNELWLSEQYI